MAYNASNAVQKRYVHGPGIDNPIVWYEGSTIGSTTRRFLMADERGSIVSITDSAGATLHINAYDEYGIPAPGNLGRFGYTGQAWLPEVGMWYYKARIFSPTLGRFMQTDPIGYADGMNWYAYVGSDPVNFGDPIGKFMTCTGSLFLHPDGFDCGGPGGPAFLYVNGVNAGAAYMSRELAARDALPAGTSTKIIRQALACMSDPQCVSDMLGGNPFGSGCVGGGFDDSIVVCGTYASGGILGDLYEEYDNSLTISQLGELGETAAAKAITDMGYTITGTQVRVKTPIGLRIIDFIAVGPDGPHAFEVKVNLGWYSSLQRRKDNLTRLSP